MDEKRMTAADFEAALPRLGRFTEETIDIARSVLVEGKSQVEVARERGLTRQRVSSMVKSVLSAANEVPREWERVEVWLPPALAAKVREMEATAKTNFATRSKRGPRASGSRRGAKA